ncbi:hypothetical protein [Herbiconiux sp. A18JL235]|uniref:Uncharacterized protein n=1 Tax=Herbiconiux sp. A18JL235 TaxID=3152363 RepID=A0AB39BF09_9MICO
MNIDPRAQHPSDDPASEGFGLPVYVAADSSVERVGVSTQSHGSRVDVVEVGYVVPPRDAPDCEQPSVWSWRVQGLDLSEALQIHACTHLVNHLPEFRAGQLIPTTADMDALRQRFETSPFTVSTVPVDGVVTRALRVDLDGWEFTSTHASEVLVTIAGRQGFAQAGVTAWQAVSPE